jgi:hypothetical protein
VLDTEQSSPDESARAMVAYLDENGYLSAAVR